MKPQELTFSGHLITERKDRLELIQYVLGDDWGIELIRVKNMERKNCWNIITTKGLFVVLPEDETFVVTMYFPSKSQVLALYKQAKRFISSDMRACFYYNEEKKKEWERKFSKKC